MKERVDLLITAATAGELPISELQKAGIGIGRKPGARQGVRCWITGMGSSAVMEHWPDWDLGMVLNIGTAGALESSGGLPLFCWRQINRVGVGGGVGGEEFDLGPGLPLPGLGDIKTASLMSVERAGLTPSGADLYDMEAYTQAKICRDREIPFFSLKWVSDYGDLTYGEEYRQRLKRLRKDLVQMLAPLMRERVPATSVSALIPVYNRPAVKQSVVSVLQQDESVGEVVLVDDGSDTETAKVCESLAEEYPRVSLCRQPVCKGVAAARNLGVKVAKGTWIALLDSDDLWLPDHIRSLLDFLWHYPHYEIAQSQEVWWRHGKRVNPPKASLKPWGWIWQACLSRCLISPSAVMLHKKLLLDEFFDEKLAACEDYDLWLRMARERPVGLSSKFTVYKYGGHKDQLSKRYPAMDRFRVYALLKALSRESDLRKRRDLLAELKKKQAVLAAGLAKRGKIFNHSSLLDEAYWS